MRSAVRNIYRGVVHCNYRPQKIASCGLSAYSFETNGLIWLVRRADEISVQHYIDYFMARK